MFGGLAAFLDDVLEQVVAERVSVFCEVKAHVKEVIELERAVTPKCPSDVEAAPDQVPEPTEGIVSGAGLRARIEG